ncbi:hypothetical protein KJ761_00150, partial [Patescibacteria group bacterium]|nr:hypothetical protein [Patescibacteria group bacterium]
MKKPKQKPNLDIKERIEDFFNSDSVPANTTKFLLMFLALGGVLCAGSVIPGILKALENFKLLEDQDIYNKKKLRNVLGNLKRQKLVEILNYNNEKVRIQLTNKGKKRIKEYALDILEIKKPKIWDKKWRILIFDIPTKPKIYNRAREALRNKIKELGFYQMQKSVWVYPYECEDELLFIAEAFEVQKYIEIITAEKTLHEDEIKRKFDLK